ncbi:MAG TPA: hypothetical protein VIU65_09310 [Pyrinomonadaceae bacterium]
MARFTQFFWAFAEQLPSLLAMLGGLVFALTRWKRYPKVAMMVALGLGLLLIHAIIFLFVYDLVPPLFVKDTVSQNYEEIARIRRNVFLVLGLLYNATAIVGYGLLVAGIFMQRGRAPHPDSVTAGQQI